MCFGVLSWIDISFPMDICSTYVLGANVILVQGS